MRTYLSLSRHLQAWVLLLVMVWQALITPLLVLATPTAKTVTAPLSYQCGTVVNTAALAQKLNNQTKTRLAKASRTSLKLRQKSRIGLTRYHLARLKRKAHTPEHGGPSAPEVQTFKAAGDQQLVNLFTGDFQYNIPLLDVGGYPVTLAYNAGVGLNDEASWVGLGWNLNPGSVSRTVRGLPDDFAGDQVLRQFNMKANETTTISVRGDMEVYGFKALSMSNSIGVSYNNYNGWSLSHGMGVALTATKGNENKKLSASLSLDLEVDSRNGAAVEGNIGLSAQDGAANANVGIGMKVSAKEGLEEINFGAKAKAAVLQTKASGAIRYISEVYPPKLEMPLMNSSVTFNATLGGEVYGLHINGRVQGAHSIQKLSRKGMSTSAYGFLYAQKAQRHHLLDFTREKDGPYQKELPNLNLTAMTPDLYQVSADGLNEMFRPFRGDVGIVADPLVQNHGLGIGAGVEIGLGNTVHGGFDITPLISLTESKKWEEDNAMNSVAQFLDTTPSAPLFEPVYFKSMGETTAMANPALFTQLGADQPTRVALHDPNAFDFGKATNRITHPGTTISTTDALTAERTHRVSQFTWRTGADMHQKGYYWETLRLFASGAASSVSRILPGREHHISQIEVTNPSGVQYIYSIPAYNNEIKRVSFNVGATPRSETEERENLTSYAQGVDNSTNNTQGNNHLFNAEITPSHPYAWLLSAIVSPDYQDVNQNGPSPDDFGNYTKFTHERIHQNYQWRTPYAEGKAGFDERMESDPTDNQGNYIYGSKEIWNLKSIETRNYIAVFETSDRDDAKGVRNENGAHNPDARLKKLDRIKLFTQQEYYAAGASAVPLKTVHFEYDYSLCPGSPGSDATTHGKLTLRKVWFTFQNSNRDAANPYSFEYGFNPRYAATATDRWNSFRPDTEGPFNNSDYPFVKQTDRVSADLHASAWNLSSVILPSGGYQRIEYESDDYAFVQDKPAMEMVKVLGFNANGTEAHQTLIEDTRNLTVHFELPSGVAYNDRDALRKALTIQGKLYFNMEVLMAAGRFEHVEGFAELDDLNNPAHFGFSDRGGSRHAWVRLRPGSRGRNPVRQASYNLLRTELGDLDRNSPRSHDFLEVLPDFGRKLVEMFQNGVENWYDLQRFALHINDHGSSYIRLMNVPQMKIGGGHRVKAIVTGDNWAQMLESTDPALNTEYRQRYNYTTIQLTTGQIISTGVAEYEPLIGNQENPMVQPIAYAEERTWSTWIDKFQLEPYGEMFMPAASVGYSKVSTEIVDREGRNTTGRTESEYYTARDFPVRVQRTELQALHREVLIPVVVYTKRLNAAVVSQGFVIETNDMHGKPKSSRTYDANGVALSGADYTYKTLDGRLSNTVPSVRGTDLTVRERTLGVYADYTLDARQYINQTGSYGVGINIESMQFGPVPVVLPIPVPDITEGKSEYRGITLTKHIHRNGIVARVMGFDNGASITTENLLWDASTGQTIVHATEHAFGGWTFSTTIPAYWAYPRMGHASTNSGASVGVVTVHHGRVAFAGAEQIFAEGDELILNPVPLPTSGNALPLRATVYRIEAGQIILINPNGTSVANGTYRLRVNRSGYRNILSASVGSYVSEENPIGAALNFNPGRVLASAAQTFSDFWQTDLVVLPTQENADCNCTTNLARNTPGDQLLSVIEHILSSATHLQTSDVYTNVPGRGGLSYQIESNSGTSVQGQFKANSSATPCSFNLSSVSGRSLDALSLGQTKCNLKNPVLIPSEIPCGTPEGVYIACGQQNTLALSSPCANLVSCTNTYRNSPTACTNAEVVANPYVNNVLGCWRAESSYAIVTARTAGNHVRESGYLEPYQPFWSPNAQGILQATSHPLWKRAETITTYNSFGSPLETVDALGRFSASFYGHGHTLNEASAINARYTQIGFDGFEEYHYYNHRYRETIADLCMLSGHFMFKDPSEFIDAGAVASSRLSFLTNTAHSGKYALRVQAGTPLEIAKTIYHATSSDRRTRRERVTGTNFRVSNADAIKPFQPSSGKYLVSVWVHEEDPLFEKDTFRNAVLEVQTDRGTDRFTAGGPIIEGWQQITGEFEITGGATIKVRMRSNNGEVLFDDLRVHPFEALMTSHSYEDRTLRLMSSHDTQNFAQFFEYDSEGQLARKKQETERGILTLQEARSGRVKLR